MNVRHGAHQPHLGRGRRLPHGLPDGAGGGEHGFAAHIQPDLAVGVGRSGPEHAPEKFLAGERLAGALTVEAHVLLTEAPAPDQRRVVVQAEVVLHPQDGGLQLRIARIKACDVPLPLLAQGADAQRRLVTLHIHHGAEVQRGVHALAKVRVHHAVPVVDRKGDAHARKQVAHALHQAQVDILLLPGHVPGVELLHVGKHGHIVDARLPNVALQRLQLGLVVEAGITAEAEDIAERVAHGRSSCRVTSKP